MKGKNILHAFKKDPGNTKLEQASYFSFNILNLHSYLQRDLRKSTLEIYGIFKIFGMRNCHKTHII
jgi:hypothetical protein